MCMKAIKDAGPREDRFAGPDGIVPDRLERLLGSGQLTIFPRCFCSCGSLLRQYSTNHNSNSSGLFTSQYSARSKGASNFPINRKPSAKLADRQGKSTTRRIEENRAVDNCERIHPSTESNSHGLIRGELASRTTCSSNPLYFGQVLLHGG
ncbi:hypothetical protein KQX54_009694 [Cotesia glomerata]|uniref:Uncharacterized protein n=1 Tax=Cotesia glomerata TaxID=32391 RepID=A0AAV7J2B3_COTGL|nr:hypothetical protein KQX54_009694 [Cotesia glomerata]